MDPVSHVICGVTLVSASRAGRLGPPLMAAIGALSPDVDVLVAPFGWDRYLRVHEIGTHSIAGAVGCALVVAVAARAAGSGAYRLLAMAAGIGALSHVALDLLSGATIRLLWPFAEARLSVPLVAMADPWLGGVLAVGFLARWIPRADRTLAARLTLAAAAALLIAKAVVLTRALDAYTTATASAPAIAARPEAEWGSLTTWLISDRTADSVRRWRVDALAGQVRPLLHVAATRDGPAVRRSRGLEAVRHLHRTHAFVFAVNEALPDSTRVLWSDISYCWDPAATGRKAVALDTPQRPRQAPVACGLWFGGVFALDGTPRHELVVVGDYVRAR